MSNLVPVTLGNIAGGSLIALAYVAVYRPSKGWISHRRDEGTDFGAGSFPTECMERSMKPADISASLFGAADGKAGWPDRM
jgi:hypothetical protein